MHAIPVSENQMKEENLGSFFPERSPSLRAVMWSFFFPSIHKTFQILKILSLFFLVVLLMNFEVVMNFVDFLFIYFFLFG